MKRKHSPSSDNGSQCRQRVLDFGGNFSAQRDAWFGNTFTVAGDVIIGSDDDATRTQKPSTEEAKRKLLASLSFPGMETRQHQIANLVDDFGTTCQWLVTPGSDRGFLQWLQQDGGLFWINGLPGTGKSTLMDFLDEHLRHNDPGLLASIAAPKQPLVLTFFFISSKDSTILQKTFNGLYRHLCYQLLRDDNTLMYDPSEDQSDPNVPTAIQVAYPPSPSGGSILWSVRELKRTFTQLVKRSSKMIFLLLDGLDEFEGDHHELLAFLEVCLDAGLKICCAGRPDDPYRTALQKHHSIQLQDVNANDVRSFCEQKLRATPAFCLVDEIVRLAEGVFLWAAVVTFDIRRASTHCDIGQLRDRLERCPTDMLKLYRHMVDRPIQDPGAEQDNVPYLKIITTFSEVRDSHRNLFCNQADISLLELLLAEFALKNPDFCVHKYLSEDQVASLRDKVQYFENLVLIRCLGLIHSIRNTASAFSAQVGAADSGSLLQSIRTNLIFVHKTALDFLVDDEVGRKLLNKPSVADDEIEMVILRAYWGICHVMSLRALATAVPEATDRLNRGLDSFAAKLVTSRAQRLTLYQTLKNVCERLGSAIPSEDVSHRTLSFAKRQLSVVSYHDLSPAEHIMYLCAATSLDISDFFDWIGLSVDRTELVGALVLHDWWTSPTFSNGDISAKNLSILLSLCRYDRVLRYSELISYRALTEEVVFERECDLWTICIAKLISWFNVRETTFTPQWNVGDGSKVSDLMFKPFIDNFIKAGASPVDHIHLDLWISWPGFALCKIICVPHEDDSVRFAARSLAGDHRISWMGVVLHFSVSPSWILDDFRAEQELVSHEIPQAQFHRYNIPEISVAKDIVEAESVRLADSAKSYMTWEAKNGNSNGYERYRNFSRQIDRFLEGLVSDPLNRLSEPNQEYIQTLRNAIKNCFEFQLASSDDDDDDDDDDSGNSDSLSLKDD